MGTRILKRFSVFFITVVMFVAVIAPCFNLGEKDVYAASSYTYTSMVRKKVSISEDQTLDYYLVEPKSSGKYDVVILFSGLYGVGNLESTFLYNASRWVATKKIKPVVFVIPILEKFGSHKYFRNFVDEKISGKTKIQYLFDKIRDGSLSRKANPKTNITVAGYSMGGCAALYAGILYKDIVKNVGALSPSYRTYNGTENGWISEPEELVFTDASDRHLFMCASKVEKGTSSNSPSMFENMQLYLQSFKTPFVTKTYSKGEHKMSLFQEEIFTFLYYVQHNKLPSSSVIKKMKKKKLKPRFITVNGKKYYLKKNGAKVKGWKRIKGKYYYFSKKTGVMKTGWLKLKKKTYYLSSRGRRYTGWHKINGKKYYFYKRTGVMAKNTKIGKYRVGKDGARK